MSNDIKDLKWNLQKFIKMFAAYRDLPLYVVKGKPTSPLQMLDMVNKQDNIQVIHAALQSNTFTPTGKDLTLEYYRRLARKKPDLRVAILGMDVLSPAQIVAEINMDTPLGKEAVEQHKKLIVRARKLLTP